MLADDDLDLDPLVTLVSDDLVDDTLCGLVARREPGEQRDHDVAGLGLADAGLADEDLRAQPAVGGHDDTDGAVTLEPADHTRVRPLDDPRDHAAAPLTVALAVRPDGDDVSVHRAVRIAGCDEVIALGRVDETVAMPCHRDAPGDEPFALGFGDSLLLAHSLFLQPLVGS